MTLLTPYQIEALDFKKHILLTANAGSGKTFVLAKRFVEIALTENISLNSIVAITFTDKAASELYKKIAKEIDSRIETESDGKLLNKLVRIRRQLVSAKISTIHSFCSELLREFSPQAGLDAGFTLIDPSAAKELIEKEIMDHINKCLISAENEDIKYLIRVVGSVNALIGQLKLSLNKIKTVRLVYEKIKDAETEFIENEYRREFNELYSSVIEKRIDNLLKLVSEINAEVFARDKSNNIAIEVKKILNSLVGKYGAENNYGLLLNLQALIFTQKNELRKRGYLNKDVEMFQSFQTSLQNFYKDLKFFEWNEDSAKAEKTLAHFGKILINNIIEISDNYTITKKKYGYLDYEDLLHFSEKLIQNENVRNSLAEKYNYFMIDEFQDTNETQYNIFIPILNNLNSGNLFVVGDEKQSIYMFRDAELKVFQKTKEIIEEKSTASGILQLPHSFRVSPKIAFFCNQIFSRLFADPDVGFNEVEASNLVSTREDVETGEIQFLLINPESSNSEANLVALKIIELVNSKVLELRDIAILVRKRKSFDELEKELTQYNIPYNIIGGKGFYQQQVVSDVYSYLSFIINPSYDSALVAVLRSPFYTLSDDLIFDIAKENGLNYFEKLKLYGNKNILVNKTFNLIQNHLIISRKIDLPELIRIILRDTDYWSVISTRSNHKQQIANLNKLLNQAKHYNKHSFKSIYDFVDYLKNAIDQGEDEGQAQIPDETNSVNLMTIHQAKGLEYKAVFLFNCHSKGMVDSVKSKSITVDKEYGVLAKLPNNSDYFNEFISAPILGAYDYKSFRKTIAETKRLLYVAITRAVNNLYICGSTVGPVAQNSFLSLIAEGLNFGGIVEGFDIKGDLQFLTNQNEKFIFNTKQISVKIPVINYLENISPKNDFEKFEEEKFKRLIDTDKITSTTKNEIISATKINIFTQCPLKYHLTYNLGYTSLFKRFNFYENSYLNSIEDEETIVPSDLKGRIIHEILEKEIAPSNIETEVEKAIRSELVNSGEVSLSNLISEISNTLKSFINSEVYKEISSMEKYKNEFELYLKMTDFYLYGIIDKIIFAEDKLIVVDYKTDKINSTTSVEKFNYYKNQLLFYAFIANRYFDKQKPVEIRLIYIDQPELSLSEIISSDILNNFSSSLEGTINSIRNNNYPKNFSHCQKCHFAIKNKCVVK